MYTSSSFSMSEGKPSGADQSTSNGGGGGTANGSVQPECENEGGGGSSMGSGEMSHEYPAGIETIGNGMPI